MPVIEYLKIKKNYRYLWLKHVNDVNLEEHCAKCLIGKYNKTINVKIKDYENIILPESKYHYLCSVADYKSNIHLAFREKKGNEIIIDNEFFSIKVYDAEQITIDNNFINYELPQSQNRLFNTCRNWWFANWVKNQNELIE